MKTIFRIALRNVLRHKRRALITALTMMVGIGLFIAMDSVLAGVDRMSINNMINLSDSAVRIYTKAYDANRQSLPLDNGIADPAAVKAKLRTDPRVAGVTERTQFLAQLSNYKDATYAVGTVIDPATDATVYTLKDHTEGSFFGTPVPAGSTDRRVVMGKQLADKLGLKVGDTVVVSAQTRYNAQNADDFQIVGLLTTGDPAIDSAAIYITYNAANDFLDLGGLVTEMDVSLHNHANLGVMERNAAEVASFIGAAFPNLKPYTFQELAKAFLDLLKAKRLWTYIIIFVILLIAAVGIVNTVLMSVYERIREVGVLKALGFRRTEVLWMFTLEGLFVGIIGSIMGAVFGLLADWYLIAVGIPVGESITAQAGMAIGNTLYGEWNSGTIIFAVVFGIVVAVISAFIPARRAAKMTATYALHFV